MPPDVALKFKRTKSRRKYEGMRAAAPRAAGVAAVFTPKDFQLNEIMSGIVRLIDPDARAA